MAKKTPREPFEDLEQQAYHAYREWHLWLMLRERELSARLSKTTPAPSRAEKLKARTKSAQEKDNG